MQHLLGLYRWGLYSFECALLSTDPSSAPDNPEVQTTLRLLGQPSELGTLNFRLFPALLLATHYDASEC